MKKPELYVLGFAFYRGQREVVLIQKTKPKWQAGLFNGVGGKIEGNELSNVAMAREFKEETGCDTAPSDWLKVTEMRFADAVVYCFTTRLRLHGTHAVTTTTEEAVRVCDVDNLPENIIPNLAWLIPMAMLVLDNPEENWVPHTLDHE